MESSSNELYTEKPDYVNRILWLVTVFITIPALILLAFAWNHECPVCPVSTAPKVDSFIIIYEHNPDRPNEMNNPQLLYYKSTDGGTTFYNTNANEK